MLRPSIHDDAVSVNTSAYGDGIRHALASVGFTTERALCAAAAHHFNDHSTTAHPTLRDNDGHR